MLTVDDIRTRYPDPCTSQSSRADGTYCVGGACLLVAALPWRDNSVFPQGWQVAQALRQLNPLMGDALALDYARRIIHENDAGHFDAAWQLVSLALKETASCTAHCS